MNHPSYVRPTNDTPLSPAEKKELLRDYFIHYDNLAKEEPQFLNMKLATNAARQPILNAASELSEADASNRADQHAFVKDLAFYSKTHSPRPNQPQRVSRRVPTTREPGANALRLTLGAV